MKSFKRSLRIGILLTLFISSFAISAQDDNPETITVSGSGIANPLLQALIDASETDLSFDLNTVGTTQALNDFCAGITPMATASRVINIDENTLCIDNDIDVVELLIGYEVVVLVRNPDDAFLTCLTQDELNTVFAPSASNTITNWSQLAPEGDDAATETDADTEADDATPTFADESIDVLLPPDTTVTYNLLDELATGFGFRNDATVSAIPDIIDTVSATSGAIGAVSLAVAEDAGEDVQIVDIDTGAGCQRPSVDLIEQAAYPAALPLLVYVNRTALDTLQPFVDEIISDDAQAVVQAAGMTPASLVTFETNRRIVSGEIEGQAFSAEETEYNIAPNLTGDVSVGGTALAFNVANSHISQLTSTRQELTITTDFVGDRQGIADFCAGELDMLFLEDDSLTCPEETTAPVFESYGLGTLAVVLLSNEGDDYATCLTTEQVREIWRAESTETVTAWNQLGEVFPEQEMTLFGLNAGAVLADVMLAHADGGIPPIRVDTEQDRDPLYRAAAVANVEGALTYMSWVDYQDVQANEQSGVQLVGIDSGEGCIFPTEETITDGSYPLKRSLTLFVNQAALAGADVQALVWTTFGERATAVLETADIYGLGEDEIARLRDTLLVDFRDASAPETEAETTGDERPDVDETETEAEASDVEPDASADDSAETETDTETGDGADDD
jgi:ABC-type phosphate transport system substrate-binding protein